MEGINRAWAVLGDPAGGARTTAARGGQLARASCDATSAVRIVVDEGGLASWGPEPDPPPSTPARHLGVPARGPSLA